MFKRALILFTLLTFLSSCATAYNPATGRKDLAFIDVKTEKDLGVNINKNVIGKAKLSGDPKYVDRLKNVTGRLLSRIEKRGIDYKIGVVVDKSPNAFTIPGGYIYATSTLMDGVNDTELAACIAHEIAHSEARHAVKQLEASMGYSTLMNVGYLLDPRTADQKKDWQYVKKGSDAVFKMVSLGYSRADEYEADRLAVRYMIQAGYDPRGMLSLMAKLKAGESKNDPKWAIFLRSHPYLDDRMALVNEEINKYMAMSRGEKVNFEMQKVQKR
ncbi:MAG TPA: M48 family metalloprotease [Candidatus Omnitrophota bacterium]|nr:M48 family metalloprotease [Candidatus Omnitrophota bacterium]HPS20285.1 M48 family metalloprotease [Candidatus Omnitrophota bacterium]